MITKFVIVTTQRTGSTYLWRYLNTHPEIRAHGEIFYHKLEDSYQKYWRSSFKKILDHFLRRGHSITSFLDQFYLPFEKEKAIGFKLMYTQIKKYPYIHQYICENKISVIHLIRKNLLRVIVSREIMRKTKKAHFFIRDEQLGPMKIYLNPERLLNQIRKLEDEIKYYSKIYKNSVPYLEIKYEDFFSEKTKWTRKILRFLKVSENFLEMSCNLKKANPYPLNTLLKNYEEIFYALKGTEYEEYIYS